MEWVYILFKWYPMCVFMLFLLYFTFQGLGCYSDSDSYSIDVKAILKKHTTSHFDQHVIVSNFHEITQMNNETSSTWSHKNNGMLKNQETITKFFKNYPFTVGFTRLWFGYAHTLDFPKFKLMVFLCNSVMLNDHEVCINIKM